jgi:predicted nucleotidyltransferase
LRGMLGSMGESDLYLQAVVARHRVTVSPMSGPERIRRRLLPLLRRWAGENLEAVVLAGSYAKGTAIRTRPMFPADTDTDLFLSLKPDTPGRLEEIYGSIEGAFREFQPRKRNVAVRIVAENTNVDLTPGRRHEDSEFHTLWQNRYSTWLQTNVAEQGRFVQQSGAADTILAAKIWRRRQALRFPSYCLELAAIRALARGDADGLSERFLAVLRFLRDEFPAARLADPANSNNIVSDALEAAEKARIAEAARQALAAKDWSEIL